MNHSWIRVVVVVGVLGLALSGCGKGDGLDGKTFHPVSGGPVTIEFKGGKAKIEIAGETKTLDYKVEDDKVTIINTVDGNLILTKHPDGTLTGALGEMVAK